MINRAMKESLINGLKNFLYYILVVLLCWVVAGILLVCSFVPVLNKKFLYELKKVIWE